MPPAVSATVSRTMPVSGSAAAVMRTCRGAPSGCAASASRALTSRFSSTCSIATRSPSTLAGCAPRQTTTSTSASRNAPPTRESVPATASSSRTACAGAPAAEPRAKRRRFSITAAARCAWATMRPSRLATPRRIVPAERRPGILGREGDDRERLRALSSCASPAAISPSEASRPTAMARASAARSAVTSSM